MITISVNLKAVSLFLTQVAHVKIQKQKNGYHNRLQDPQVL